MPDAPPVTIARRPVRSMPAITSAAVEVAPNGVVMVLHVAPLVNLMRIRRGLRFPSRANRSLLRLQQHHEEVGMGQPRATAPARRRPAQPRPPARGRRARVLPGRSGCHAGGDRPRRRGRDRHALPALPDPGSPGRGHLPERAEPLCGRAGTLLPKSRRRGGPAAWMDRFVDYLATKRGMAGALHAVLAEDDDLRMKTRGLLIDAMATLLAAGPGRGNDPPRRRRDRGGHGPGRGGVDRGPARPARLRSRPARPADGRTQIRRPIARRLRSRLASPAMALAVLATVVPCSSGSPPCRSG